MCTTHITHYQTSHVLFVAGDFSDAAVEEFAWAVRRSPAGEALDRQMLSDGLLNLDSRGLAALLKELARGRHGRRAREVSSWRSTVAVKHGGWRSNMAVGSSNV